MQSAPCTDSGLLDFWTTGPTSESFGSERSLWVRRADKERRSSSDESLHAMDSNRHVTALRTALLQLANEPAAMEALAKNAGLPSAEVKSAYLTAVDPVLDALAHCEQADQVVSVANSLGWADREKPVRILGKSGHNVSLELAKLVYVGPLTSLREDMASDAGISKRSAGVLLKAILGTAVAMTMSDSGPPTKLAAVAGSKARVAGSNADDRRTATAMSERSRVTNTRLDAPKKTTDAGSKAGLLLAGLVLCAFAVAGWALVRGGANEVAENTSTDLSAGAAVPADEAAAPAPEPVPTSTPEPVPTSTPEPAPEDISPIVSYDIPMSDIFDAQNPARGILAFDFDTNTGEVCYTVASVNIAGPYRSHIHVGGAGEKGGIVVDLGPLESGAKGCVDNLLVDTNAILSDLDGHYAELHDVSEEWTIRGQLSEGATSLADELDFSSESGGAYVLVSEDSVSLEGAVTDETTALQLATFFEPAGVVNNLQIDAAAPPPSGRVIVQESVFAVDTSTLPEVSPAASEAILLIAELRPEWLLTAVGRTDGDGSALNNLELSLERAKSYRNYLTGLGIAPERLRVRGAGEFTSLTNADSRRLEFEFLPAR